MSTPVTEVIEFLGIVSQKGFLNANTVNARQTALRKFSDILDDNQKNVEYLRDNLDIVRARFSNLNKDVNGATVDEYARRVKLVLDDFDGWTADRSGWERTQASKTRPSGDGGEKKTKPKAEKPRTNGAQQSTASEMNNQTEIRSVSFPLSDGNEMVVKIPKAGVKVQDLKRAFIGLLPYASDWEIDHPSQDIPFMQLGNRENR